jgi:hypothetical protein
MRHALMYIGGFETNFPKLTSETSSFEGSDGAMHAYPAWPSSATGLRIGFMERTGKKFVAVRIADDKADVVLTNDMILIPGQHFGFGVRLSGEPVSVEDDTAILQLLEDALKKNANTPAAEQLLLMRARLKGNIDAKKR